MYLASFIIETPVHNDDMTYQYRPLERDQNEIRLVSLLPEAVNHSIRLSIHHTLLAPSASAQA